MFILKPQSLHIQEAPQHASRGQVGKLTRLASIPECPSEIKLTARQQHKITLAKAFIPEDPTCPRCE